MSSLENEGVGQHRVVFSEGMQGSGPVQKWNLLPDSWQVLGHPHWTWGLAVSREHCGPGLLTKGGFRRPLECVHPYVCTCLCMSVYTHAEISVNSDNLPQTLPLLFFGTRSVTSPELPKPRALQVC